MSNKAKTARAAAQIESTPKQTVDISSLLPTEAIEEIVATNVTTLDPINTAFKAKYGITVEEAPAVVQRINERLLRYEKAMAPNVVIYSPSEGADNQIQLFNTFMRALSEQGNELFMCVDLILSHMWYGRSDVYSSRLVYRFIKNIRRPEEELNSYLKILEILIILADPSQRISLAKSGKVRQAVSIIDPRYRDAALALVTYLSQYQS